MRRLTINIVICAAGIVGTPAFWPVGAGAPTAHGAAVESGDLDAAKLAKVQAAFLLNFVKFTSWPRTAFTADDAPLVVTVIGDDRIDDVSLADFFATTLRDRKIAEHSLVVRSAAALPPASDPERRAKSIQQLGEAHVVFIGTGSGLSDAEVRQLDRSDVLTIAATPYEARRYAILSFGLDQGKVIFFYNADAARESALILSSKLLALARPAK
jgi:hypothetical protein